MGKASSPVRFQKELMESAAISGQVHHRSAVGQIEYWATIGRMLDDILEPETLLAVTSGFKRLTVENTDSNRIDPDELFSQIEARRNQGELTHVIPEDSVAYQASIDHPGLLERLQPNGEISVGQFENGRFVPLEQLKASGNN